MIRPLQNLAAPFVNAALRRLNKALDGHNARVSSQSREAVERATWGEKTPVSPRGVGLDDYVVYYDGGAKRHFYNWPDARDYWLMVKGYGLVNTDRQTDGDNYAGLTEEQRGELGL
jgi:hypothetical protein